MEPLTFDQLCELEPRLRLLYEEARAVKDDPEKPAFCANNVWYGYGRWSGIKARLCRLVGWDVKGKHGVDERLATEATYDTAYDTIYDQLPDCRNCNCA